MNMKTRVPKRAIVRAEIGGICIRYVRAIRKAANIMVTSRMETVIESLSRASPAINLASDCYLVTI